MTQDYKLCKQTAPFGRKMTLHNSVMTLIS